MRHHKQRGQALIESALVGLILIATLIGIFDLAQIFFTRQTLNERVRNAARWAAVHAYDANAIRNMVLYGRSDGSGAGALGLTADMVTVSRSGDGTSEDRIVVSIVNYPYKLFTPLIAGAFRAQPTTASIPYEMP